MLFRSRYLEAAEAAHAAGRPLPEFPEAEVVPFLDNTWRDTARAIFDNWLGLVYQLTNLDRRLPFMAGVDPDHPLASLGGRPGPVRPRYGAEEHR